MENAALTNFQEWGKFYPKKVSQKSYLQISDWLIDWLNPDISNKFCYATLYQRNDTTTPLYIKKVM